MLESGGAVTGLDGPIHDKSFDADVVGVLAAARMFKKFGVNVGAHELFTPSELVGTLRWPSVRASHRQTVGRMRHSSVEIQIFLCTTEQVNT